MPLTDKQTEYLKNCSHRWNVKTGATGSGKSFVDIAVTIPKRIMAAKGEGLLVLMGNTRGTLERNILEPMRTIWQGHVGNIRSDNTVSIFGKKVYALGADNKKHVARIQGATFEYVYGDEITTWAQDVFEMLKSRLRCAHSHFDGTCNPDNPLHWFKRFLDSDADIYQQSYIIDDGVLPPDTVAQLKREYAGTIYYQRYILGLWAAAEGVIYRPFADNPERYIINAAPTDLYNVTIGVDFGGGTSAHAFSCVGFTRGYRDLIVLDEWHEKAALTPAQLEQAFVNFVRACQDRYLVTTAYCDSAEQTLIKGLRTATQKARLPIDVCNAAKKSVNDRIRCATRMMAADRFKILNHCTHTIEAYRTALWDSKALNKDVRLDNGTTNIDSLDATEYAYERYIADMVSDMGWR